MVSKTELNIMLSRFCLENKIEMKTFLAKIFILMRISIKNKIEIEAVLAQIPELNNILVRISIENKMETNTLLEYIALYILK